MRRRTPLLALSTMAAVLVTGCAVGANYSRPPLPTPEQYRFVTGSSQAESVADLPWWQVFDDPTLQALIREATANNLDLQAAVARLQRARAQLGIAKSFLYPQIDATASYTGQQNFGGDDDDNTVADDSDGNDVQQGGVYGFQLSWELDLFGRIRREREAAFARMLASEQGRRGVLVTLVGDVATNYFLLRELDLQLFIARETLRLNDESVTYFRNRLEGGVSNRLELDRIQANRALTAASIPDLEQQIAIVENAISLLLGKPPAPVQRQRIADNEPAPPPIPPGLPASLIERRPDVLEAEQFLVAANADIGAARAAFFPSISLTGEYGVASTALKNLFTPQAIFYQIAAGLVQPVFDGFRLEGQLEQAQGRQLELLSAYRRSIVSGFADVERALIAITDNAELERLQRQVVTASRQAFNIAETRLREGTVDLTTVLITQQALFNAQDAEVVVRLARLQAVLSLYQALGGSWMPPAQNGAINAKG